MKIDSREFQALSAFLQNTKPLWETSYFTHPEQAWQASTPKLYAYLLSLDDAKLRAMESDQNLLHRELIPFLGGLENIIEADDATPISKATSLPQRLNTHVPGRKWQQIAFFCSQVKPNDKAETIIDWCAGKSYLGRAVAHHNQLSLSAIEKDQVLCEHGKTLAERWVPNVEFNCDDVLLNQYRFKDSEVVVALHACGELHRHLLQQWRDSDSEQLVLAPCCYHKWLKGNYQPMSSVGRAANLSLSPEQVHLAVQETVTATDRESRLVRHMQVLRLAFDELQRDLLNSNEYLPTPSLSYGKLNLGDEGVIRLLAQKKKLVIPSQLDIHPYLIRGEKRHKTFLRLQLLSHCFRPLLERWILLDLAFFLVEYGIDVQLKSFCQHDLTPRNICLIANK